MNTLTFNLIGKFIRRNFIYRFYKYMIFDSLIIIKQYGFKELIKKRGLKFVLAVLAYYMVRDTLLYIVLPMIIALGIL